MKYTVYTCSIRHRILNITDYDKHNSIYVEKYPKNQGFKEINICKD